jgi:hypothetical protein
VLAAPDVWCKVVSGLLRLPRLSLSRRVRFTNRFTELVTDLPICTLASRDNLASAYQAAGRLDEAQGLRTALRPDHD